VLIEKHRDQIWAEFQPLLEDDKVEDLGRMFSLLNRIARGLDPLKDILEKHVQTVGANAVESVAATAVNVRDLISLVLSHLAHRPLSYHRTPNNMWRLC
jgi:cullin 1